MVEGDLWLETWGNEEVAKSAIVLHQSLAHLSPAQQVSIAALSMNWNLIAV